MPGHPDWRVTADDLGRFADVLRATPRIARALMFTPEAATDPYLNDGAGPLLAAQLYFADIAALEAALARDGALQALTMLPGLAEAELSQQAMLVRRFPVPDPVFRTPAGDTPCTYQVSYDGVAEDLNLWLSHYLAHHPPIMARFPGIRDIEVYSRIDWCGVLPGQRANCVQRNKVVFDSAAALTAALQSPVRHEMRADFHKLPPFSGTVRHFPMATITVVGIAL